MLLDPRLHKDAFQVNDGHQIGAKECQVQYLLATGEQRKQFGPRFGRVRRCPSWEATSKVLRPQFALDRCHSPRRIPK